MGQKPPFMKTRKNLRKKKLEKNGKNLLLRVGEEPRKIGQKKARTVNSYGRLNNTQLLTNSDSSSKHFILFKLFLTKSKSINLAFFLTNLP